MTAFTFDTITNITIVATFTSIATYHRRYHIISYESGGSIHTGRDIVQLFIVQVYLDRRSKCTFRWHSVGITVRISIIHMYCKNSAYCYRSRCTQCIQYMVQVDVISRMCTTRARPGKISRMQIDTYW